MSSEKEIVVYERSTYCPYQAKADRVFKKHNLQPRRIMINKDQKMEKRVIDWTGYKSVPTIIIAEKDADFPYEDPVPLARGTSPRGVDRGSMITEAYEHELEEWLQKHGFIAME